MDKLEILQKLAKGEITKDKAYALLTGKPTRSPRIYEKVKFFKKEKIHVANHMSVGEHVEKSFPILNNAVSLDLTKGKYTIRYDEHLDEIRIIGDGSAELVDKSVKLFGKFEILIPKVVAANIAISAGSLKGEVYSDTVNISAKTSSVYMKISGQICNIANKLGSVNVSFSEILKVLNVTNKLGSINIGIPRSFNGVVNTSRKFGAISFSSDIIFSYSKFGKYIIGNNGDAVVNIATKLGSVEVSYDTGREVDENLQDQEEGG